MEGMQINGQLIVDQFFQNYFHIMLIKMFRGIYSDKKEAENKLDEYFGVAHNHFDLMLKPLATQDLTSYLEIKKAVQANYTMLKSKILNEPQEEIKNESEGVIIT